MQPLTIRCESGMPTGSYEILIDLTAEPVGVEVSLEDVERCKQELLRRALAALSEPAPLTRGAVTELKRLECGLIWVVLRFFVEAQSCTFEPGKRAAAEMEVEALLSGPVRELFPSIVMWTTRVAYRPEMGWPWDEREPRG